MDTRPLPDDSASYERLRLLAEQKNAALLLSEERYHKMVEEVEDYAILLLDIDGRIMNWNKGAEKIKGYKEAEIIGRNFRIFYRQEDQQRQLPEKLIQQARSTGKAIHEGWRVRKDGTTFWGSIVITALHDDHHNIIGFSKVTRDLTERKIAENKIKQYAKELEAQNRDLQQFAYAAAHDMKEPLRKVQFYTSTLLEGIGATLPPKERSYLERAVDAAQRMQRLIEDLFTYTRISGEVPAFEQVPLNNLIEDVLSHHQETIASINAYIEIGPLPVVPGITFQLRQLLDNLIGNSLKYHHTEKTPHIVIQSTVYNDKCEITIQDNGIGFEPQNCEKIFEIFERLHGRENYPGTGIGLALCQRIVRNHQGTITATGQVNEGATFTITLPIINME
ncbi:PAS domain S-box protein [Chitinophaga sancti]|uniref:sensor histidine kinase n=1 Tax=Chitinophaga sancti TaxID=1004 RepID=UPI002A75E78D|nr:ATP-binding protein [Chitinophaga sancti]WPQ62576.1 PAS domain S-box protein [Chitinophaga sancti]